MIRAERLMVELGGVRALALDHLEIADGERVGIRGPNGSGKSTLLRVLAGFVTPSSGSVTGLPPPGRTVLVHQRPYFLRGTARANVAYALRVAGRPKSEAADWLERLGAGALAERDASVLSGGERRRVAVARALCVGPEVSLLDLPFAALDEAGIAQVTEALIAYEGTLVIAAPDLAGAPVSGIIDLDDLTQGAVVAEA